MSSKYFSIVILVTLIICSSVYADHAPQAEGGDLMLPLTLEQWNHKRQSYQPNIVVVDMWAMWCTTCIEQFPEMVALHERHKDANIIFVSMNLDDREDSDSITAANRFLEKINATFEHYHMNENLMHTFEQLNLIGIPAVLIYNQRGEEQFRLTGDNPNKQFSKDDIEQAIQALLTQ